MRSKQIIPGLATALLALVTAGCHSELSSIPILDGSGEPIRVTERPAARPEEEGIVAGEPWKTPLYRPDAPLVKSDSTPSLAVTYQSTADQLMAVFYHDEGIEPTMVKLPKPSEVSPAETLTVLVPTPATPIRAFEFVVGCKCGRVQLLSLVQTADSVTYKLGPNGATVSATTSVYRDAETFRIDLGQATEGRHLQTILTSEELTAGLRPAQVIEDGFERPWVQAELEGQGMHTQLRLYPRQGTIDLRFHPQVLGFQPDSLTLDMRGLPVEVRRVEYVQPPGPSEPVPVELGGVLSYPQSQWRQVRYEFFEWTLYPNIYILDFADYAEQSSFFKRLAFFTEKRGFRGRIPAVAEVAERHGWNAHNYSAEGLARFYQEAELHQIVLTEGEQDLKQLALTLGLLVESGRRISAGEGGLLSISRASSPALRELVLNHEAFHGVFYSSDEFRSRVWSYWDSMSELERQFWRDFLSYMSYDPTDDYLMVNEFQAYVLQQPPRSTNWYLSQRIGDRLRSAGSPAAVGLAQLMAQSPRTFWTAAETLNYDTYQLEGLIGGHVFSILPVP